MREKRTTTWPDASLGILSGSARLLLQLPSFCFGFSLSWCIHFRLSSRLPFSFFYFSSLVPPCPSDPDLLSSSTSLRTSLTFSLLWPAWAYCPTRHFSLLLSIFSSYLILLHSSPPSSLQSCSNHFWARRSIGCLAPPLSCVSNLSVLFPWLSAAVPPRRRSYAAVE